MLLGVHVAVGVAALVLGPFALITARPLDRQTRVLLAYQASVLAVCASALILTGFDWSRLWWLTFFAVGTAAAVVGGRWAASGRPRGWAGWYVRFLCGSYVALVTALLVVSWPSVLAWVLPTLVGAPLIETAAFRAGHRRPAAAA